MSSWEFGSDVPSADSAPLESDAGVDVDLSALPFQILGVLGEGGMGRVYHARDELGREVALKVLRKGKGGARAARLQREGQLAAALDHPNVVRLLDHGVVGDHPYVAYELVAGESFAHALERASLPQRVRLLCEVAAGVAHAHERGVVHRDLKPGNVLIDAAGRAKVADLGLGTAADVQRLTRSGAMVGTPRWMAPEQIEGKRDKQGPATDVWALGVMLYHALTGDYPFRGETLINLAREIMSERPTPLRQLNAEVPEGVEVVCLRALERDPAARYPHAGAMLQALEAATRTSSPAPPQPPRRARWILAVSAVLLTFALGIAGSRLLSEPELTPASPSAAEESPGGIAYVEGLQAKGEFLAALAALAPILAAEPRNARAWCLKGDVQASTSSFGDAQISYRRSVELGPTPEALTGLGISLHYTGHSTEGLTHLAKALELAPNHADAFSKRSLIHYDMDRDELALRDANRALEIAPDAPDAWNAKGLAHGGLREYEAAEKAIRRSLSLSYAATPVGNLAQILVELERFEEAVETLEAAIAKEPHAHLYSMLGFAELRRGRFAAARDAFTKCLKLTPTPLAHFNLAFANWKAGKRTLALAGLKRVLSTAPPASGLRQRALDLQASIRATD